MSQIFICVPVAGEVSGGGADLLRRLTLPVGSVVAIVVILAWVVTWATTDFPMALIGMPGLITEVGPIEVALFFTIMVVMMVAMMLPAALPMIVAYHGMTRLEAGQPSKAADLPAAALFVTSYFLIWGAFALLALLALTALGVLGPLDGPLAFVPGLVLLAAGVYQITRAKDVCLHHCQSPMSFVTLHWRSGRLGALRMGLRHSMYCLGCCWLFMIALFVAGSTSLAWMGALSVVIFAEKVGTRRVVLSRAIGAALVLLAGILLAREYLRG